MKPACRTREFQYGWLHFSSDDSGEYSQTLCGKSILDVRLATNTELVTCPLCEVRMPKVERESNEIDRAV